VVDPADGGDGDGAGGGRLPRWVDGAVSVLHAAFGDVIDARVARLAIPLSIFEDQRPLPITTEALRRARPRATGRVCVLVHGLGCHGGVWAFPAAAGSLAGANYGTLLARDLGFTSYAVRYNTGLNVARTARRSRRSWTPSSGRTRCRSTRSFSSGTAWGASSPGAPASPGPRPRRARGSVIGGASPGETVIVPGVSHLGLCHDARVYERIRGWCAASPEL